MKAEAVELCGLRLSVCVNEHAYEELCARFLERLRRHAPEQSSVEREAELLPSAGASDFQGAPPETLFSTLAPAVSIDGQSILIDMKDAGPFDPLQSLLRAYAMVLVQRDGLLLHGASVELNGRGVALCGPSGAGKTTIARRLLAAGAHVIGDEVAAVRSGKLFGHPLQRRLGDGLAPTEGIALSAIALIGQSAPGAPPRLTPLSAPQAARQLIRRVFMPSSDGSLVAAALETCERLCASVPVYSLLLPNDERATAAALALLGQESPLFSAARPARAEAHP